MGNSNIVMYTTEDGVTKIEVTFEDDTVWLSLEQMAELFQRDKSTVSRHVKNIFAEGELKQETTVAKFATVQMEGNRQVTRDIEYYNLDVIISVGYRVKSLRGTQFRIWASSVLKEYMKKGFALDDERLKRLGGGNYFDELLARIRDIRSSEKVFWRKMLEIYATSIDYDPRAESSVLFFKQVQNKMHWAAHKHTAAEIVQEYCVHFPSADALTTRSYYILCIVSHIPHTGRMPGSSVSGNGDSTCVAESSELISQSTVSPPCCDVATVKWV